MRKKIHRKRDPIFSGASSGPMWDEINNAKTVKQLRQALYLVCCKIQELEAEFRK